jgi:nitrogen permease regulator 3-like protein
MMVGSRDGIGTWGRNLSVGAWRPHALEPWKGLLLLSGPDGSGREWVDVYAAIRGTNVREEDKLLAEQLIKFLETVDVTLSYVCSCCCLFCADHRSPLGHSFMDVANLLDWDLETLWYDG